MMGNLVRGMCLTKPWRLLNNLKNEYAIGVYATDFSSVINNGTVNVGSADANSENEILYGSFGLVGKNGSDIINTGSVNMGATAIGMYADNAKLTNNGTIDNYGVALDIMDSRAGMYGVDNSVITNNNFIREYGTTRTRYKMKIEGVSDGNNSLDTSQIQIIENSYDGKEIKDYEINDKPVIKIGVNDDYYDTIKQEDIRNSFFDKIRANILKLHLVRTNFGIQRGTLINLVFFTNQADLKHTILTSSSNIAGENKETNFDKLTLGGMNKKDLIQDEGIELPIPSLSGLYYVDSMKFIYNKSKAEIDQYLYLIKKGPITNLVNKTTPTRLQNDFYPDAVTLPDTPDTTVEARSIVFN